MASSLEDFQDLLRTLFQFDAAVLDFGIYRVLNRKRDAIEAFMQEDLVATVCEEMESLQAEQQDAAQLGAETERRIYDDLVRFFRRYYEDGDFVTKRRFTSHRPKYFVPYDGEEVLLHWTNRDQYYIKTSERFTDYHFTAGDYGVHFKLHRAHMPTGNKKAGDTRYFVLRGEDAISYDAEAKRLTVHFAYRSLTEGEDERLLARYNDQQTRASDRRKTSDRRTINAAQAEIIREALDDLVETRDLAALRAHLSQETRHGMSLQRHLGRYTARNTSDYFIHKDLGAFLRGQLDFFLKNEVLRLDDVLGDETGQAADHALARTRIVKRVGERIIAFLAQVEDFQKCLFKKKKFVVETNYCVTLDQVPDDLCPEILENNAQLDAWRDLYRMDEWEENRWQGTFDAAFLEDHPHLMIDTAFFDEDFKDRLLASFDDLEAAIDGLLIQGDNFQALNLLQETYREKVQCTYIDPPYNTGNDGFIYKDKYRHSSWLSMMADRLRLARALLSDVGSCYVSADDNELYRLKSLLADVFGEDNELPQIIWKKRSGPPNDKFIGSVHEYIACVAKREASVDLNLLERPKEVRARYTNPDEDPRGPWVAGDISANAKGGAVRRLAVLRDHQSDDRRSTPSARRGLLAFQRAKGGALH